MEKAMPEGQWIRHHWQTEAMAVAAASGMVAAAEVLRQPEVIFPEIAALTIGGWVAAAMVMFLVLLVARRARLYFPPAGAVALLPFLLPVSALRFYPLSVAAGFALLGGAAMGIRRIIAKPRIK